MSYQYQEQLRIGQRAEAQFIHWLDRRGYKVRPATVSEQFKGIDLWFEVPGRSWQSVELKEDNAAIRTGNAFIETVCTVATGRRGWAYTCEADWLIVSVRPQQYWIRPGLLAPELDRWVAAYGERTVINDTGNTKGVPVPLDEIASLAAKVTSWVE